MADDKMIEMKSLGIPKLSKKIKTRSQYSDVMDAFEALAYVKGFATALKMNKILPDEFMVPELIEKTDPNHKLIVKAIVANSTAMAYLTQMCVCPKAKKCLIKSKSEEYPGGLAHVAITRLNTKYRATSKITMGQVRRKLYTMKFKSEKENPLNFFERLEIVLEEGRQLNKDDSSSEQDKLRDSEIFDAIAEAVPTLYKGIIREKIQDMKEGEELDLDDLEDSMFEMFSISYPNKITADDSDSSDSEDEVEEKALVNQGGKFSGKCYKCGEVGHKANDPICSKYKDRSKNYQDRKSSKFNGTCHRCGKFGHQRKDCWENETNKDKRPQGWKTSEKGLATKEDGPEFMLVGLDTPLCKPCNGENFVNKSKVRKGITFSQAVRGITSVEKNKVDADVTSEAVLIGTKDKLPIDEVNNELWIADSGASMHVTGMVGMLTDMRTGTDQDIIYASNG